MLITEKQSVLDLQLLQSHGDW